MQISDHGHNDGLAFDLAGQQSNVAHIRQHLPNAGVDQMIALFRAIRQVESYIVWRKTQLNAEDALTAAMETIVKHARAHQVVPA